MSVINGISRDPTFNVAAPDSVAAIVANSPYCDLHRLAGQLVTTEKTYDTGSGADVATNLFTVSGIVEIRVLYGVFTDVSNVAGLTVAYLDVYDSNAATVITKATGTTLSGAALGSLVAVTAAPTEAITFANASAASVTTTSVNKPFEDLLVVAKTGASNYIRSHITEAAETNCKVRWYCGWVCRCAGSSVVAS